MLEVLASLTLDPAVADALLDGADGQLRQVQTGFVGIKQRQWNAVLPLAI